MQDNQPNPQHVNNSLLNQLAQKAMDVAERDAVIAEQQQEIEIYKKKTEKMETEIAELKERLEAEKAEKEEPEEEPEGEGE